MMSENLSYWDQFRRASRTFYDALDKRPRLHGNGWVVWNNNETVIDRPFLMNVRKKNEPSELHVLWPFTLREYFSFFILSQILLSSYLFSLIQRSGRSFHFFFPIYPHLSWKEGSGIAHASPWQRSCARVFVYLDDCSSDAQLNRG